MKEKNMTLPLEFKLRKRGKIVGYMYFDTLQNSIWSRDGKEWGAWSKFAVDHDEKCQYTGYLDRYYQKIYFGDILINLLYDEVEFIVQIHNGRICAINEDEDLVIEVRNFEESMRTRIHKDKTNITWSE